MPIIYEIGGFMPTLLKSLYNAKKLYVNEDMGFDLEGTVYALDSTTIDLCLSLFPWAKFRRTKGAFKLHTLLNIQGDIPEYILISDGKLHDVNVLDYLLPVPGAYYVMDRGYLDFERLYFLHQAKAHFVIRAKRNFKFNRRYSHPVDKMTGVQCDQTINFGYILFGSGVSGAATPDTLLRLGTQQTICISYQRFHLAGDYDSCTLQIPLASRRVQTRTHHPVGERPTEAKRLRPRSLGGTVARKQDGGALRQNTRKGV
jgi:hypothetical protein